MVIRNGNGKQGIGQGGGARRRCRRHSPEARVAETRLCEYKSNNSKSNANQLWINVSERKESKRRKKENTTLHARNCTIVRKEALRLGLVDTQTPLCLCVCVCLCVHVCEHTHTRARIHVSSLRSHCVCFNQRQRRMFAAQPKGHETGSGRDAA